MPCNIYVSSSTIPETKRSSESSSKGWILYSSSNWEPYHTKTSLPSIKKSWLPYHNKDLKRGTLQSILKQAGLSLDDFLSCL
jgi:hypothetical protein